MKWGIWEATDEHGVHVAPVVSEEGDLAKPHSLDLDCPCCPDLRDDGIVVHHQIN